MLDISLHKLTANPIRNRESINNLQLLIVSLMLANQKVASKPPKVISLTEVLKHSNSCLWDYLRTSIERLQWVKWKNLKIFRPRQPWLAGSEAARACVREREPVPHPVCARAASPTRAFYFAPLLCPLLLAVCVLTVLARYRHILDYRFGRGEILNVSFAMPLDKWFQFLLIK